MFSRHLQEVFTTFIIRVLALETRELLHFLQTLSEICLQFQ